MPPLLSISVAGQSSVLRAGLEGSIDLASRLINGVFDRAGEDPEI
jgi:hypothetical protein